MSNFYFRCDNCGRETYGITFINGMKFCAKCYQETFGKDNQQEEIKQLIQQLKEIKDEIDLYKKFVSDWRKREIDQLKQQLGEKDKEIEMLKHTLNLYNLRHKGSVLPNVKQLAIQELEKVKNFVDGRTYCADYINKRIQDLKGE